MNFITTSTILLAVALFASASGKPFPKCSGSAKYKVTFSNFLTAQRFGNLISKDGLVFSPLAGVTHSNRLSLFTIRGFASKPVEILAETGDNRALILAANRLRANGRGVRSVVDAGAPTLPGGSTTLIVSANCQEPFVTVLGMIAPSPDWIVQINNVNLFDVRTSRFKKNIVGSLIAYDTGVDDGREFTDPLDFSLDMPTMPQQNIAPLVEDDTDRFNGRVVGTYKIQRI